MPFHTNHVSSQCRAHKISGSFFHGENFRESLRISPRNVRHWANAYTRHAAGATLVRASRDLKQSEIGALGRAPSTVVLLTLVYKMYGVRIHGMIFNECRSFVNERSKASSLIVRGNSLSQFSRSNGIPRCFLWGTLRFHLTLGVFLTLRFSKSPSPKASKCLTVILDLEVMSNLAFKIRDNLTVLIDPKVSSILMTHCENVRSINTLRYT